MIKIRLIDTKELIEYPNIYELTTNIRDIKKFNCIALVYYEGIINEVIGFDNTLNIREKGEVLNEYLMDKYGGDYSIANCPYSYKYLYNHIS